MIMGKNIRKRRRELDLTQRQIAKKCHITQSYYSQIECGIVNPSVGILEKIARTLNLSVGEIWEV